VDCASRFLPLGSFLGGHPIAGKEQRGPMSADGGLFRHRPYVLTPLAPVPEGFREMLTRFGARPVEMSPKDHDSTLAFTSHLPQVLSTALAAALAQRQDKNAVEIFGPGLLDMTRLALSTPELWSSILHTNREQVAIAITTLIDVLESLRQTLGEREMDYVFEKASANARQIRKLPI
jgi:prephenate dehydrogenase